MSEITPTNSTPINISGIVLNILPLQVGQSVTASVDIESREFNARWYTDVRAWNVVYNGQQQGAPAPAPTAAAPTAQPAPTPAKGATAQAPAGAPAAADDLPF